MWNNFIKNNTNIEIFNISKINNISNYIKSARTSYNSIDELKKLKFRYIEDLKYIINSDKETLIHLEQFNNNDIIVKAKNAIDHYYFHTLDNPSHRSKMFWYNFIEHFRVFRTYTKLPYTSSDMASSHNIDHLKCVNDLINSLKPLTNYINQFIKDNYEDLYKKLNKLSLGPFVPKSFRIFPMMTINYNIISNYHLDFNDNDNCFCVLVILEDYESSELCFLQFNLII